MNYDKVDSTTRECLEIIDQIILNKDFERAYQLKEFYRQKIPKINFILSFDYLLYHVYEWAYKILENDSMQAVYKNNIVLVKKLLELNAFLYKNEYEYECNEEHVYASTFFWLMLIKYYFVIAEGYISPMLQEDTSLDKIQTEFLEAEALLKDVDEIKLYIAPYN